jgi:hypothetical protein
VTALRKGAPLLKYCRGGKPHVCLFKLSADEAMLTWQSRTNKVRAHTVPRSSEAYRTLCGQLQAFFPSDGECCATAEAGETRRVVQVKSVPFTAVTEVLPGQRTSILKRYGQPHEVQSPPMPFGPSQGWWHTGGNQPQTPCTDYTARQLAPLMLPLLCHPSNLFLPTTEGKALWDSRGRVLLISRRIGLREIRR